MALNPKTSIASRNLALNAAFDVLNSGFLDIYDGTQPTDADTAVGAQVKLAHLPLSATACAAASAASKALNAVTSGSGLAASTATWARFYKSDGTTAVHDVSVGTTSTNLVLNDAAITVGGTVSVTSYSFTMAP